MRRSIDLNADIGESYGAWTMGDDAVLVPLVSSANIACGFHAGDPHVMSESVQLCVAHGVAIGAHPSYPDREGFGRRAMGLAPREIHEAVLYQVAALAGFARAAGSRLRHVKPHGALYNAAAVEPAVADAIARAVHAFDSALLLVGLAGSRLIEAGRARGLATLAEGFADRRYVRDGTLVRRGQPGALIEDPQAAEAQVLGMLREGCVFGVAGDRVALAVDTVCVHSDGSHAVALARRLRARLRAEGIEVRAAGAA